MFKSPLFERLRAAFDAFLFPSAGGTREQRTEAEYMPDRLSAFFMRPAKVNFVIIRATLACFLLLFVWSALAHLEEVTVGEGKVIPSSQVQVIQNLEGGIVNGIPVRVGDIVQRDQIVLHIDPTRFSSSLGETKAKYHALLAKIARLEAEAHDRPIATNPELERENPQVMKQEFDLYITRQNEQEAAKGVLQQQVQQRQHELAEKRARAQQLAESYRLISSEVSMTRPMAKQQVISDVELLRI